MLILTLESLTLEDLSSAANIACISTISANITGNGNLLSMIGSVSNLSVNLIGVGNMFSTINNVSTVQMTPQIYSTILNNSVINGLLIGYIQASSTINTISTIVANARANIFGTAQISNVISILATLVQDPSLRSVINNHSNIIGNLQSASEKIIMRCVSNSPFYANPSRAGLSFVGSESDGYETVLTWNKAYADSRSLVLGYNIYFSSVREDVFDEGAKFLIPDGNKLGTSIFNLTLGDVYYFAVRAAEFDPAFINLNYLPEASSNDGYAGTKVYPSAMLTADVGLNDLVVNITDVDLFPPYGIVKIGYELIRYSSLDIAGGKLILANESYRGFYNTTVYSHTVDGYDGYEFTSPLVTFFSGFEELNTVVYQVEVKSSYPNYPWTRADGYKEIVKDLLNTDLSASDVATADFPRYDYSGYHRTDPIMVLNGECIGSYIGGEFYCADGYDGVGRQVRGISINDQNTQRQELLLTATGEPCCLLKRMAKGKVCKCIDMNRETPEPRCPICYGVGFVSGYEQFFNPRRSDGRVMVRFGPTVEDMERQEPGLENKFIPDCWTIVYPAIKDGDVIIRFNEDNTEEFRYEILNVTRNKVFLTQSGMQKFVAQRVRKFSPIYQIPAFRDTSTMPSHINTSIGYVAGPGGIAPHTHVIQISETITNVSQINQLTGISLGHDHPVINGVVKEVLGHTHNLIL